MEETQRTSGVFSEGALGDGPSAAAVESQPLLAGETVAEAVEEIVAKVESGEAAATPTRRKSERRVQPSKAKSKVNLEETVDTLATTVNSLADSMASMAATVETLSDKVTTPIIVEAPAPVVEPEPEPVAEVVVDEEKQVLDASMRRGTIDFLSNSASFFGAGMVAYAALRPTISSAALLVGVFGVVLFAVATVFDRRIGDPVGLKPRLRTAGAAAVMAIGIGFAVGGAIFFGNAPHRAARLIPVGTALFAAGFFIRGRYVVAREHLVWVAGVGLWVCLGLTIGLSHLANNVDPEPVTSTEPVAAVSQPADVATNEAPATEPSATEEPAAADEPAATDEAAAADDATTDAATTEEASAVESEPVTGAAPAPVLSPDDAATIAEATKAAAAAAAH